MVSKAGGARIEIPRFGHRIARLSRIVYALNLQMLRLLREDSIGRAARQEITADTGAATGERPLLQIGDQGRKVSRLQRPLSGGSARISTSTGSSKAPVWSPC